MRFFSYYFLTVLLAVFCLSSCKQSVSDQTTAPSDSTNHVTEAFSGHWIIKDYIDQLLQFHSISEIQEGLEEIYIKPEVDSIYFTNGFEEVGFGFKRLNDTILQVEKFNQDSLTNFVLSTQGHVLSYKNISAQKTVVFSKVDVSNEISESLFLYQPVTNQHIVAGNYKLTAPEDATVVFEKDGKITGWKDFQHYELCIAGDCRNFFNKQDLITLSTAEKTEDFLLVKEKDSYALYEVVNVNKPDEMPFYEQGKRVYVFQKKG
ncbi:hypothetical protein QNI19_13735 [Cytophagaceae bacterium DM2B3-1]|uniref:Lipocalin-like domain-containing protein n=1 Tax=Xanthocytophaga flava TaxID=3048013 RepID=A0ABT7CLY4_9BACT|nr:hypothetical protein [Xanthocytophaga flavus]MDJ1469487.1 hypothetical protein [Xanthocytophaga flavus]MDJ1494000.1 hypothetical protein [Xanthocytophaga flavus]